MNLMKNSNLIIPPWDSRYGKLGHIWKKYNWELNNLYRYFDGYESVFYYIPPELIISEFESNHIIMKTVKSGGKCNWISNRHINRVKDFTGLTPQELFDILILKINNKSDRPRCSTIGCKCYLNWSGRFSHGYFGDTNWVNRKYNYCSQSCRTISMRSLDPVYYSEFIKSCNDNTQNILTTRSSIKSARSRFINMGSIYDECYFYIALTYDDLIKFGITFSDLETRSKMELWKGAGSYKCILSSILNTRLFVANLETLIKFKFNGNEYINKSDLTLLNKYVNLFTSMNIKNILEFDQLESISTSTTIP